MRADEGVSVNATLTLRPGQKPLPGRHNGNKAWFGQQMSVYPGCAAVCVCV